MAEGGQKRDRSSHRTPGQIKRMDRGYNARPEHIRRRDDDNKARKMLKLKVGDKRDAAHIVGHRAGGKTIKSNLKPLARSKNRGWRDGGDK